MMLGNCRRGQALQGNRVCIDCPEGFFSEDARACVPCPTGATCSQDHVRHETGVAVKLGVIRPASDFGHWLYQPRASLIASHNCGEIYAVHDCVPTQDEGCSWHLEDKDRLFNCLYDIELYVCPVPEACTPRRRTWNVTAIESDYVLACEEGYASTLCRACREGYTESSDMTCVPCEFDQDAYITRMSVFTFLSLTGLCIWLVHGMIEIVQGIEWCCDRTATRCRRCWGCGKRGDNPCEDKCLDSCEQSFGRAGLRICCGASEEPACCKHRWCMCICVRRCYRIVRKFALYKLRLEKIKIFIVFLQLLTAIRYMYRVQWPRPALRFLGMLDIFSLDLVRMGMTDCQFPVFYYMELGLPMVWCVFFYIFLAMFYTAMRIMKFEDNLNWLGKFVGACVHERGWRGCNRDLVYAPPYHREELEGPC